jgi:cell division protein YceG involved in septum cleavage
VNINVVNIKQNKYSVPILKTLETNDEIKNVKAFCWYVIDMTGAAL